MRWNPSGCKTFNLVRWRRLKRRSETSHSVFSYLFTFSFFFKFWLIFLINVRCLELKTKQKRHFDGDKRGLIWQQRVWRLFISTTQKGFATHFDRRPFRWIILQRYVTENIIRNANRAFLFDYSRRTVGFHAQTGILAIFFFNAFCVVKTSNSRFIANKSFDE